MLHIAALKKSRNSKALRGYHARASTVVLLFIKVRWETIHPSDSLPEDAFLRIPHPLHYNLTTPTVIRWGCPSHLTMATPQPCLHEVVITIAFPFSTSPCPGHMWYWWERKMMMNHDDGLKFHWTTSISWSFFSKNVFTDCLCRQPLAQAQFQYIVVSW